MLAFPDPMPHRFSSEEAARSCVLNALSGAQAYVASPEGVAALATLDSDDTGEVSADVMERVERAAEAARDESGVDVEIEFEDGSLPSLFIPTFMDAILLGVDQAKGMVDLLTHFDGEADARIVTGALAYENLTGFDDAMIWLHALSLAGLLDTKGDDALG